MSSQLFDLKAMFLEIFRMGRHLPPPLRSAYFWRLFCTPFLHARDPADLLFLRSGRPFMLPSGRDYLLPGWLFPADGPTVVLNHGWQGSAASWHVLAPALSEAGFRVVVFHSPGHHSKPRRSSLPDFSQALEDVMALFPPQALVGHSFGAMTVARVARTRPELQGVALFSSPDRMSVLADGFCHKFQMTEEIRGEFWGRLRESFPHPLENEAVSRYLAEVECPVLLLHDTGDEVIPVDNSRLLAREHGLDLVETSGLGHRRIIRDRETAEKVVNFLSDVCQ